MRGIHKSFFIIACACSVAVAQTSMQGIRKLLDDQVEAWNKGDIEGFMRGYWDSDSTMFNSGGNLTKGYRHVLERYKKNYATRDLMGKLDFRDLVIRMLSDNAAVVMGTWKLKRAKDQPWGRFTLIVERKPEGWRITHDHTSSAEK
jgi:beta-aspartyl-peptidase (threonine type)